MRYLDCMLSLLSICFFRKFLLFLKIIALTYFPTSDIEEFVYSTILYLLLFDFILVIQTIGDAISFSL